MKKFVYLAMALGLVACQAENPDAGGNGSGEVETNYLSVKLVTSPTTRATYEEDYEDGSSTENKVSAVRFYFFNSEKDATEVRDGKSYYDLTENEIIPNGKDNPNVEKILEATLIIETEKGHEIPHSIIAVLNPPQTLKNADIGSVADLRNFAKDFKYVEGTDFLMSNAVYADGSNVVNSVEIGSHIYTTAAAALADPVTVYVERVLAKVNLKIDMEPAKTVNGAQLYKTSDNGKYTFGGKEIYVKFFGWNVTTQTNISRAMKRINVWPENLFHSTTEKWNYPTYHRSFWGVNPTLTYGENGGTGVNYVWGSFGDPAQQDPTDATAACHNKVMDGSLSLYIQENASDSDAAATAYTKHPTQVILAGQLVDEDGVAIPFANYAFEDMPIDQLYDKYASLSNIYVYKYNADDPDNTHQFTQITKEYIQLKTAMAVGEASQTEPGRYYVYAQLIDDENTLEELLDDGILVIGNSQPTEQITEAAKKESINSELIKLGHAKVWTSGYTYYFFNIRHLGAPSSSTLTPPTDKNDPDYEDEMAKYENMLLASPGYYGIVRNHVYKTVVTGLKGLGTPVFNPNEVIYPEKPVDDNDSFVASEIRILSWRIVNHTYDLDWE